MAGLCEGGNEPSCSLKAICGTHESNAKVGHPATAPDTNRSHFAELISPRGPKPQALPECVRNSRKTYAFYSTNSHRVLDYLNNFQGSGLAEAVLYLGLLDLLI
ncbi:hypothetical protein ANN_17423 [Periplaneta americana]|uniref:Uncharacterized protein n=1 Tax=Periplaneta americana TaxID=6978 RepID=A0ABQ8SU63_PERAM|nr:hypothetical protein ANN_17423 [Periplaneta americana]